MKIFVTGGTGNIGQHVTLALAARGHQVELLTRPPDRIPAFQNMENVHVVKGCLQEPEGMKEALQGCDAVIHIALGWGVTPNDIVNRNHRDQPWFRFFVFAFLCYCSCRALNGFEVRRLCSIPLCARKAGAVPGFSRDEIP